jgi:hypothetical protein
MSPNALNRSSISCIGCPFNDVAIHHQSNFMGHVMQEFRSGIAPALIKGQLLTGRVIATMVVYEQVADPSI